MIAGHLREIKGRYYMVLSYKDREGKRFTKTMSTGLEIKSNKRRAEAMLDNARLSFVIPEKNNADQNSKIKLTGYLLEWLDMSKQSIALTTYASYESMMKRRIIPYFSDYSLNLDELKPKHIQDFYTYGMNEEGLAANTIIHWHAVLRKALQYAMKTGLIDTNPADRVDRPRKNTFSSDIYNADEIDQLLKVIKGKKIEFAVIMGAFYGLRRSEIIGLKWDAIDFEKKTLTIKHVVIDVTIEIS